MSQSPKTQSTTVGRAADMAFVRRCIQRGEHCSVVGVNNIGKTVILRAMAAERPAGLVVYVDCNRVLEWTEVGFYELLLRAALDTMPRDAACRPETQRAHTILVAPTTHLEDAYAFVLAVRQVIDCLGRVVFLLDELDNLLVRLEPRVFLNLRSLADQYGQLLTFVTATTHRLPLLRPDVEPFFELFSYRTRYLSPLSGTEAREYIEAFAADLGVSFAPEEVDFIHAQADGHPGLIRAAAHLLSVLAHDRPDDTLDERLRRAEDAMPFDVSVRAECEAIWNELTDGERDILAEAAAGHEPAGPTASYARSKHLLRLSPNGPELFCPIFAAFVALERQIRQRDKLGLRMDSEGGDVYVDGRDIPPLTELEYKLLTLLYQRSNQIVDKFQIVENVWGEEYIDQVDDDRIERLVARLRDKIEPDPRKPRFLMTVRGRGYRLRPE